MNNTSSEKNKLLNKNNFSSWIIGGIIGLIITKILEPLSEFLFSNFLNIGGSFVAFISNFTYREISNGFSEQSSSVVLFFVFMLLIGFFVNLYSISYINYRAIKNEVNELLTSIDDSAITFENSNNVTSDNLNEGLELVEKKIKELGCLNNSSILRLTILLFFLLLLLSFTYGQSSYIRDKTIVLTNNIEIVSPYISDIEYKQLKSKFHSIETQSDYNALMKELETIASECSLKLK